LRNFFIESANTVKSLHSLSEYSNNTLGRLFNLLTSVWDKFLERFNFIPTYYTRNENLWVDGFLFDFLQKKTIDAWVRQYVIYTGFLFSERLVFDNIIRIYVDNLVWPLHKLSIFEAGNTSSMLSFVLFLYFGLFSLIVILFSIIII